MLYKSTNELKFCTNFRFVRIESKNFKKCIFMYGIENNEMLQEELTLINSFSSASKSLVEAGLNEFDK